MTRQLWCLISCLALAQAAPIPAFAQCGGGAWTNVADIRLLRQGVGVGRVGNLLYIFGGLQSDDPITALLVADALDLQTGATTPIQFVPSRRYYMASAVLRGEPHLVGGFFGYYDASNFVWAYDPSGNEWNRRANLPGRRAGCVAAAVDDRLYVFGGVAANLVPQADAFAYDPGQNAWLTMKDMPTRRERMAIAEANGLIYVAGGFGLDGEPLAVVECYDTSSDDWTTLPSLSIARGGAAAGIINGKLYVMGGENGEMVATTEVYDLVGGGWSCRVAMATPRHSMAAVGSFDRIFFVGGSTAVGVEPVALVDAFIPPEFVAHRKATLGSIKASFGGRQ